MSLSLSFKGLTHTIEADRDVFEWSTLKSPKSPGFIGGPILIVFLIGSPLYIIGTAVNRLAGLNTILVVLISFLAAQPLVLLIYGLKSLFEKNRIAISAFGLELHWDSRKVSIPKEEIERFFYDRYRHPKVGATIFNRNRGLKETTATLNFWLADMKPYRERSHVQWWLRKLWKIPFDRHRMVIGGNLSSKSKSVLFELVRDAIIRRGWEIKFTAP